MKRTCTLLLKVLLVLLVLMVLMVLSGLLVIGVWTTLGRSWEATDPGTRRSIKLLDKDTILQGCPCCRPANFSSPQEMVGRWCWLLRENENVTDPKPYCFRNTVIGGDNDYYQLLEETFDNGHIFDTRRANFSKLENGSWFYASETEVTNIFLGLSADGKLLCVCGTWSPAGRDPSVNDVAGGQVARCLTSPADREQAEAGLRPKVHNCEELPAPTPASA